MIMLCTTNLKYGWCANLPSSNHSKCSAQSPRELHVRGRLTWKSAAPYGNSVGNASVKKYWVVNSETGTSLRVGHGMVIVPCLLAVTFAQVSSSPRQQVFELDYINRQQVRVKGHQTLYHPAHTHLCQQQCAVLSWNSTVDNVYFTINR